MKKNKHLKNKLSEKERVAMALRPLSEKQMQSLSKEELLIVLRGEQQISKHYKEIIETQKELNRELEEKKLCLEGKLVTLKCRLFSPKSERFKPDPVKPPGDPPKKKRAVTIQRNLLERYPNADVIEKELKLDSLPTCSCCEQMMSEMGIWEQSQYITVIPKQYLITNLLRMKYHCSHCFSTIQTTPQLPKIVPRSIYSDEFIMDVTLSKYCDLIPVDRYTAIAARLGITDLPTNSMYDLSLKLAEFVQPVYELIRIETLDAIVLHGDETPHKMLEGDEKDNWYLWGFFSEFACFFECHDTRAGSIAADILSESSCEIFMSDAFSGYTKGVAEANKLREKAELKLILAVLCNAHARRYFRECTNPNDKEKSNSDAEVFITEYHEIYETDKEVKALLPKNFEEAEIKRASLKERFAGMKVKAEGDLSRYPTHHAYYKACNYFINNYDGLSACIKDPRIPLDNNVAERGLRPSVVGRKTWYGTHSPRGAMAGSIHFTLVEACKLNGVNPRHYYRDIVEAIHYKKDIYTPQSVQKNASC